MDKSKIVKICDNLMEAGWLLIIFIVPIIFSFWPITYNLIQLPKAVIFSILVELMFVIYILKVFLGDKIKYNFKNNKLLILVGFFIISNLISLFFSIHPLRSLFGEYIRQEGAYIIFHYILFFLLLFFNLKDWKQIKRIILAILLSSSIVCFYGLAQYLGLGFTEWQKTAFGPVNGRIYASLGQPNFFGHYLIMIIPVSIFSIFYIAKKFLTKFLLIILVVSQLMCLLLTYSRSAWLGFLFEIFIFFVVMMLLYRKKIFTKKLIYKFYLPVFLLLLIFSVFSASFVDLKEKQDSFLIYRLKNITNFQTGSVKLRLLYWSAAVEEIKQMDTKRLLFGYGQENISDVYVKYYNREWSVYGVNSYPDRSHNVIFDIIFTKGLFGLAAISIFYSYIILLSIRSIKNREKRDKNFWLIVSLLIMLGGYFINNLFSFSVVTNYVYLYLFLVLLLFLTSEDKRKNINIHLTKISMILISISIASTVGISIFMYNIKPIIADYYLMKTDIAKKEKNCQGVIDNLNKNIKWHPSSTFYQDRYIYNNLNCLANDNSTEINREIKNNIENVIDLIGDKERFYKLNINIAHAHTLFGHYLDTAYYELADKEYKKLLIVNPYFTYVYKDWGRMKLWQGNYDESISILKEGLSVMAYLDDERLGPELIEHKKSLEKEYVIFYYNIGEAYFYKNEWKNSLNYYEKILEIAPHNFAVYKRIADVYYKLGNIDKAILYNRRGYMLDSNNYTWLTNISALYKERGDIDKALEYAEKANKAMAE